MIYKEVKEYSQRQRINLNKKDGFSKGDKIVVMSENEYNDLTRELTNLNNKITAKNKELEVYTNQEQNLKEIITDIINPIHENHQKELENKEDVINQLTDDLNTMKKICNQYNLELTGLNIIDILIFRKHKKIIHDFNSSIWVNVNDHVVSDTELIPDSEKK